MKIVHAENMEWGENLVAQRAGRVEHKLLFEGDEGSPDNFMLALAKESADFFSPRHRHTFDQVRYCLKGSVPLGGRLTLDAGEVAYFPEGVAYGPQEGGTDRIVLVLQMGGASGLGFLSARQTKRALEELSRQGTFEGGVYRRAGKNEDAYEAIYRHVTGTDLEYPAPCCKAPIVMCASNFSWSRAIDGVRQKMLGHFPERGLTLDFVSVTHGASWKAASIVRGRHLILVCSGEGTCGETYGTHTVYNLEPDETATFTATADTELFVIGIQPVVPSNGSP